MRLHVKMFLWFWLGVVVVSGTLVGLTELTHSRAEDDRLWREKYGPRVRSVGAPGDAHPANEGSAALEEYVGSFQSDPGVAQLHVRRGRARGLRPHAREAAS